jgi:hypothetical protein
VEDGADVVRTCRIDGLAEVAQRRLVRTGIGRQLVGASRQVPNAGVDGRVQLDVERALLAAQDERRSATEDDDVARLSRVFDHRASHRHELIVDAQM